MRQPEKMLLLAASGAACHSSSGAAPPADASTDTSDAAPHPPWLGDAGLLARAPAQKPLRELCGLASNPGDLPLGTDPASSGKRAGYFTAAQELGISLIRRDFVWSEIEPSQGQFVYGPYDALVAEASAAGVKLLALPYGTPKWAALDPNAMGMISAPRNISDYTAFAAAVAGHFAGQVAGWEIWNEENSFRFWAPTASGDPATYGALLSAAHHAMRAADPATPVLFGGCVFDSQI